MSSSSIGVVVRTTRTHASTSRVGTRIRRSYNPTQCCYHHHYHQPTIDCYQYRTLRTSSHRIRNKLIQQSTNNNDTMMIIPVQRTHRQVISRNSSSSRNNRQQRLVLSSRLKTTTTTTKKSPSSSPATTSSRSSSGNMNNSTGSISNTTVRNQFTFVNAETGAVPTSSSSSIGSRLFPSWVRELRDYWTTIGIQKLDIILRQPRTIPIPRWITPRHYTFTYSECFGHASFVLVAVSYAVDDFVLLRMIAVAGSTAMLFFTYFHPHGRVLWLPFKWNMLFIALNSYRIGKIYAIKYYSEHLPTELLQARTQNFYLMDPVDYARLVRMANIKDYKKGDVIIQQNEGNRFVRFILKGNCKVLRDNELVYILEESNFLSESGIHAGLLLPGKIESCCTVVADEDCKLLEWDRTDLVHLMECHEGVRRSLKAVLSWDIVRKLKGQRKLLSSGLVSDPERWTARRHEQTMHRYGAILEAILAIFLESNVEEAKQQLNNYRTIHHIDDEHHRLALAELGWTVEEFETGIRDPNKPVHFHCHNNHRHHHHHGDHNNNDNNTEDCEHDDDYHPKNFHDWKWYLHNLYLRLFG